HLLSVIQLAAVRAALTERMQPPKPRPFYASKTKRSTMKRTGAIPMAVPASELVPPAAAEPARRRVPLLAGWFAGLKIRRRIAVGFAASLGLLVVIAVAAN